MSQKRDAGAAGAAGAGGMDRRTALKVIAAAAAAPSVLGACDAPERDPAVTASPGRNPLAAGTKWDPDLLDPVVPWDRQLSDPELETLAVLCDAIIPADDRSPAASALGAHEFIDEWVSAPYDGMQRDKVLVRGGIAWLDKESHDRFGAPFTELDGAQRADICDDICEGVDAVPEELRTAARFFDKVRDLTATAFYTTREGMEDLGYVGNVPLPRWDPPPPVVLRAVGLDPREASA